MNPAGYEARNRYLASLCRCNPPLRNIGGEYRHVTTQQLVAEAQARKATGSSSPVSLADEIRKLDDLRRNGVLTDGEFQKLKSRLIGQA
jgi:hypothetical protein